MADNGFQVNSKTGVDGNSYTTSIQNDELTNDDFLKLMIQELKLQDPTKPMDSKQMLQTQMQMSSISTNQEMVKAMESLSKSYSQSSLSTAANVIGKNIEDGNISENGVNKAYTVRSVENNDGEVTLVAQEMLYIEDMIKVKWTEDGEDLEKLVNYDSNGLILDDEGKPTGDKIVLSDPGRPLIEDGKLVIWDANNEPISNHGYETIGQVRTVFSDELTRIPFEQVTKIF